MYHLCMLGFSCRVYGEIDGMQSVINMIFDKDYGLQKFMLRYTHYKQNEMPINVFLFATLRFEENIS